jgi:hypothetical protein
MVFKMGDPTGMGHVESTGRYIFTLDPGFFDLDRRNVPLLARPKTDGKAIYKNGRGKASGSLASTPVFDRIRIGLLSRNALTIFHAPIHERLCA